MGGPGRNGSTQPANPAIMQRALTIIRITSSITYLSLIYAQKYGIFQYIQGHIKTLYHPCYLHLPTPPIQPESLKKNSFNLP